MRYFVGACGFKRQRISSPPGWSQNQFLIVPKRRSEPCMKAVPPFKSLFFPFQTLTKSPNFFIEENLGFRPRLPVHESQSELRLTARLTKKRPFGSIRCRAVIKIAENSSRLAEPEISAGGTVHEHAPSARRAFQYPWIYTK